MRKIILILFTLTVLFETLTQSSGTFDARIGHYVVVSLSKTLNANFLSGLLRGVEDAQVSVSQWHILKKKNK